MGYDKQQRPSYERSQNRINGVVKSTAASTALAPGAYALHTTSTTGPVVYTLVPPKKGAVIELGVASIAATSGSFHVNASADASVVFGSTDNMVDFSTAGGGMRAFAASSSQWIVTGNRGGTFSTST